MSLGLGLGLGLVLDFHFVVLVSVFTEYIHSFFQHVVREKARVRVDAIFDLVTLDDALRWSLCWCSSKAAGQRVAGWRIQAGAAGKLRGRGRWWVLQRGCKGEGGLCCVQCAQWTVMLTLLLGGDMDVLN